MINPESIWRNEALFWAEIIGPFIAIATFILGFVAARLSERISLRNSLKRDYELITISLSEIHRSTDILISQLKSMSAESDLIAKNEKPLEGQLKVSIIQMVDFKIPNSLPYSQWKTAFDKRSINRKKLNFIDTTHVFMLLEKIIQTVGSQIENNLSMLKENNERIAPFKEKFFLDMLALNGSQLDYGSRSIAAALMPHFQDMQDLDANNFSKAKEILQSIYSKLEESKNSFKVNSLLHNLYISTGFYLGQVSNRFGIYKLRHTILEKLIPQLEIQNSKLGGYLQIEPEMGFYRRNLSKIRDFIFGQSKKGAGAPSSKPSQVSGSESSQPPSEQGPTP